MSTRGAPWWLWIVLPLLWASLETTYRYLAVISAFETIPLLAPLINEFTGVAGATLLIPPIAWMIRRYPLPQRPWRYLPLHLAALVGCSMAHTSLNWLLRAAAYPIAGLGPYDYGRMPTRYFMELPVDVFTYSVVGLIVTLLDRYRASRDREVRLSRRATELVTARLSQLQAQLRPHFLFNTLNTVSSVMYEDVDRADRVLADLSELLRRTMRDDRAAEVSLEEELELVRLYANIMKERFQDRLEVTVDVPDGLHACRVPPMILQPLVENAILHGRSTDPAQPTRVTVSARMTARRLELAVEDRGCGISATQAAAGLGIGLRNTQQRLDTLYGADGALHLERRPGGGSRACLTVPQSFAEPAVAAAGVSA